MKWNLFWQAENFFWQDFYLPIPSTLNIRPNPHPTYRTLYTYPTHSYILPTPSHPHFTSTSNQYPTHPFILPNPRFIPTKFIHASYLPHPIHTLRVHPTNTQPYIITNISILFYLSYTCSNQTIRTINTYCILLLTYPIILFISSLDPSHHIHPIYITHHPYPTYPTNSTLHPQPLFQ